MSNLICVNLNKNKQKKQLDLLQKYDYVIQIEALESEAYFHTAFVSVKELLTNYVDFPKVSYDVYGFIDSEFIKVVNILSNYGLTLNLLDCGVSEGLDKGTCYEIIKGLGVSVPSVTKSIGECVQDSSLNNSDFNNRVEKICLNVLLDRLPSIVTSIMSTMGSTPVVSNTTTQTLPIQVVPEKIFIENSPEDNVVTKLQNSKKEPPISIANKAPSKKTTGKSVKTEVKEKNEVQASFNNLLGSIPC